MNNNSKDIPSGTRFGILTVIEKSDVKCYTGHTMWKVKCDCGNEKVVKGSDLRTGMVKSCGCLKEKNRKRDMIGKKFGKLTVVESAGRNKDGNSLWKVQCECGNYQIITGPSLRSGKITSCKDCRPPSSFLNIEGQKFGKLTVLRLAKPNEVNDNVSGCHWLCLCECGNKIVVPSYKLRKNLVTSCGCSKKQNPLNYKQLLQQKNFTFSLGEVKLSIANPLYKPLKHKSILSENNECFED